MPIFEFQCTRCGKEFEDLVRNAEDEKTVICPACGSKKVMKLFSAFGFASGNKVVSSVAGAGDSCRTCSTKTCSSCG